MKYKQTLQIFLHLAVMFTRKTNASLKRGDKSSVYGLTACHINYELIRCPF